MVTSQQSLILILVGSTVLFFVLFLIKNKHEPSLGSSIQLAVNGLAMGSGGWGLTIVWNTTEPPNLWFFATLGSLLIVALNLILGWHYSMDPDTDTTQNSNH